MEYVQMTLNDWVEMKRKLRQELLGVKQSFVRIGYALRKIEDQKLYENDGYKSIAEFAKEEYGLEPSTTSRFMSINREYSIDGYSEQLRPEYADLGRSQLEEMLKLPEEDRTMIQPETSREDIRELKRFNKTEPEAGIADDIRQLVAKFYYDNPDILNAVFSEPEFEEETIKQFTEIINPGGNRSYKKGLYFLMMYENRVAVKKFGMEPKNLTWWEFWQVTLDIFGETAAGAGTWQNYFGEEKEEQTSESDITEENNNMQAEIHEEKQTEEDADQEEDSESEEISGQMEIHNYPEIVPEENNKSVQQESIAPAQKPEEDIEKEEPGESEKTSISGIDKGKTHEQTGVEKTEEKAKSSFTAMNQPEVTEKPFGSRKDYMDSLTAYGMADYIAGEYRHQSLKVSFLSDPSELEKWLLEKVDIKGYPVEDQREK